MAATQTALTQERFLEFLKDDGMLSSMAWPCAVHDKYGRFLHHRTVTWPEEYILTDGQVAQAKEVYAQRKKTILGNIVPGMLVFTSMGGDFPVPDPDLVGNWRIRSNFTSDAGRRYMIELCPSIRGTGFRVTESVDWEADAEFNRQELEVAEWNRTHLNANEHRPWPAQFQYNPFGVRHLLVEKDFSFTNILAFINERFGCSYTSCSLIRHIAGYEEFTCEPIREQRHAN